MLLNGRESMSDREWVALGAASDADRSAEIKRQLGVDVPCDTGNVADAIPGIVPRRYR